MGNIAIGYAKFVRIILLSPNRYRVISYLVVMAGGYSGQQNLQLDKINTFT